MKKSSLFIPAIIISSQLMIIWIILGLISSSKTAQMYINPISKDKIVITPNNELKYFYEPVANSWDSANYDWMPSKAINRLNSDTLNEFEEYQVYKKSRTFRIVALGDSFTYGLYVNTRDNWVEQLEMKMNQDVSCSTYNKYEAINLGVHGYDIEYTSERFLVRGEKYAPDVIIWYLKNDDFGQINEYIFEKERDYAKTFGTSDEENDVQDKEKIFFSWENAINNVWKDKGKEHIIQYQTNILRDFIYRTDSKIIFMVSARINSEFENILLNFQEDYRNKIFVFNTLTDLYSDESLYFQNDLHPNKAGHAVIANDVFTYLTQQDFIECN